MLTEGKGKNVCGFGQRMGVCFEVGTTEDARFDLLLLLVLVADLCASVSCLAIPVVGFLAALRSGEATQK